MTKRRAESSSLHEAPSSSPPHPQKKSRRSACDAEPGDVHAPRAAAAPPPPPPPPARFTALIGERRRKRPRCCEDHEPPGGAAAPGRLPSVAAQREDARVSGKVRRAGGARTCTCETPSEGRANGSNPDERTKVPIPHTVWVSRPGAESEGELCAFNSFQFWRAPLPALDLSLLDSRPTAELTRSRKDATEEMET